MEDNSKKSGTLKFIGGLVTGVLVTLTGLVGVGYYKTKKSAKSEDTTETKVD